MGEEKAIRPANGTSRFNVVCGKQDDNRVSLFDDGAVETCSDKEVVGPSTPTAPDAADGNDDVAAAAISKLEESAAQASSSISLSKSSL